MAKRGLLGLMGTDGVCLEEMSDYLLRCCNAIDEGIYTELQLTKQDISHADSMERVWEAQIGEFDSMADLADSAWADIKGAAGKAGVKEQTVKMIEMHGNGYTYDEIGVGYDLSGDAVRKRVERAIERITDLPEFGMWVTISSMLRCEKSWWLRYFWEMMALAEQGR
jgi:hypothetical protein